MRGDSSQGDQSRFYEYHRDRRHTTEECRHLHYYVEWLIQAKMLQQYVEKPHLSIRGDQNPYAAATFATINSHRMKVGTCDT